MRILLGYNLLILFTEKKCKARKYGDQNKNFNIKFDYFIIGQRYAQLYEWWEF